MSREPACGVPALRLARAPAPPLASLQVELTTREVEGQAWREPPSSAGL